MDLASTMRAAENRSVLKKIVAKSFVLPHHKIE